MNGEMIASEDCEKFANFIKKFEIFLIVGHENPDGDCIASALVLRDLIERFGKKAFLLSAGPFVRPEVRKFEKFFSSELPAEAKSNSEKTAVVLEDCSETSRVGEEIEAAIKDFPRWTVDHHKTAEKTENSIVRGEAPATAHLAQILYEKIWGELPQETAKKAFFGLATDSGFFRFLEPKDAQVFQAAARLAEAGANPKEIYREISGGKTLESRKLLGILLARTESVFGGKILVSWETADETKAFGKENRDSDTLYDLLLSCENVAAVALIRCDNEKCTVGLRSNGDFDVSKIASAFGGGGHKNASGLSAKMQIPEMKSALIAEFGKALQSR